MLCDKRGVIEPGEHEGLDRLACQATLIGVLFSDMMVNGSRDVIFTCVSAVPLSLWDGLLWL